MGAGWFVVISAVLLLIPISASALSRSDIDVLQTEAQSLKDRNIALDALLTSQRQIIDEKIIQVDLIREELRVIKSEAGQSWDALRSIDAAEKKYTDSKVNLAEARRQLTILLDEKNTNLKRLMQIPTDIEQTDKKLKQMTPFNQTGITKLIGIKLSKTCLTLIQNNITSDCPTYDILKQLDSSREDVTGHFVTTPYTHRALGPYNQNIMRLYDFDDTPRIIVDPPNHMVERMKMITIEKNLGVYLLSTDMQLQEGVRTWHEGRYIDNCKTAYISTNNWLKTLPDTIYTMRINCSITGLEEKRFETMPFTELPLEDTQYWKDKMWLEESKKNCKGLCFEY